MLRDIDLNIALDKATYKERHEALERRLISLQRKILELGIPVIVAFEGWSSSGKGALINEVCQIMDPRSCRVYKGSESKKDCSYLLPFWKHSPAKGFTAIFDRSWYRHAIEKSYQQNSFKATYVKDAINFENHLWENGTLVIKFFLHLGKAEQLKRLKSLRKNNQTSWRVNDNDFKQNKKYAQYMASCSSVLEKSPRKWVIVEANNKYHARWKVLESLCQIFEKEIMHKHSIKETKLAPMPKCTPLQELDHSLCLTESEYKSQFKEVGAELKEYQYELFKQKKEMLILYEGWDAAGKGGNIRRLTRFLDPRDYRVCSISAPSKEELSHDYMWRFWQEMPSRGQLRLFDRTWYGRVLVERVEGFCTHNEWQRAYEEINAVESHLVGQGVALLKFWLDITADEQLRRFKKRQEIPHKQWKITDEDWRNRNKWSEYQQAVNEMLIRTNTSDAPWTLIEANNKYFARLKVLKKVSKMFKQWSEKA